MGCRNDRPLSFFLARLILSSKPRCQVRFHEPQRLPHLAGQYDQGPGPRTGWLRLARPAWAKSLWKQMVMKIAGASSYGRITTRRPQDSATSKKKSYYAQTIARKEVPWMQGEMNLPTE
jgi:hypothetical protein